MNLISLIAIGRYSHFLFLPVSVLVIGSFKQLVYFIQVVRCIGIKLLILLSHYSNFCRIFNGIPFLIPDVGNFSLLFLLLICLARVYQFY